MEEKIKLKQLNNMFQSKASINDNSKTSLSGQYQMNYQDLCFPSKRDILSESKKEQLRQNKMDEDMIDDMVFSDNSASTLGGRNGSLEM